jgi:hypothetical protein
MLDLNDHLASYIYGEISRLGMGANRLGRPARPEDTLQLALVPYSPLRQQFSPTHQAILDHCAPSDIRVALLSEGRTMVMKMPGAVKLEDKPSFLLVQDDESRKAG